MKVRIIVLLSLLMLQPVWAGSMTTLGAGKPPTAAGGFQGPGDILATNSLTPLAAYSCGQAYTAAQRGTKTCEVCDITGGVVGTCADILSDATTGIAVPQVIGAVTCPGNATLCGVRTLYDKVGTACSGACDVIQAVASGMAVLKPNAVSTNACLAFIAGTTSYGTPTLSGSTAQPWSMTVVAERTASFTSTQGVIGEGTSGGSIGFNSAANQAQLYAGGGGNIGQTGVADSAFHAIQGLANGASSFIYTDGTASSTGNPGTSAIAGTIRIGSDAFANRLTGLMCLGLFYSGTSGNLSASQSSMNTLLHSNWGF